MFCLDVCDNLSVLGVIYFIKILLRIICIVVPVILILMLTIDLYQGIVAGNDEKMQQVKKVLVKRIAYAVVVFFVPTIVNAVMNLLDDKNVGWYFACYDEAESGKIATLAENARKKQQQVEKEKAEKRKQTEAEVDNLEAERQKAIEESKKNAVDNSSDDNSTNSSGSVSSSVTNAKTYKKIKILKVIGTKDAKKILTEKPITNAWIGQSFTVTPNHYVTARVNSANTYAAITVYSKKDKKKVNHIYVRNTLKHANGMTYNSSKDEIYTLASNYKGSGNAFYRFSYPALVDGSIKKSDYKKKLAPHDLSGIAYDSVTGKVYFTSGSKMYVWSGNGKKYEKDYNKLRTGTTQDIGGYNGVIYVIRRENGDFVDMYRASDGKYLGSYSIKLGRELESIAYYGEGKKFALYFNEGGNNTIWVTKKIGLF